MPGRQKEEGFLHRKVYHECMELSFETGKGTELIYAQKENPGNNREGYTINPAGN